MLAQVMARGSDSSEPSAGWTSKDCRPKCPRRCTPVVNLSTFARKASSDSWRISQNQSACVLTSSLTVATSRQRWTSTSLMALPAHMRTNSAGLRRTRSGQVRREPPKTSRMPSRKASAAFCSDL